MSKMADIRAMKEALEAKIESDGQSALKETFTAFFEANPTVDAIRWRQYTPYFNDGDACTFSVRDFNYQIDGGMCDGGDYGDGFVGTWSIKDKALEAAIDQFEDEVRDDDLYESIFGDHVKVTATREGFEIEEYRHD